MIKLVFFVITIICSYCFYEYSFNGRLFWLTWIILKIPNKNNEIFLTFDDGPDPRFTPEILKILKQYNVKATFFMCGNNIEKYPNLAKKVFKDGHRIANHGYSHRALLFKKISLIDYEVAKTEQIIKKITEEEKIIFRPPFRLFFFNLPLYFMRKRKYIFLWNVGSKDFKFKNPDKIVKRVIRKSKAGSIITMHDGNSDRSLTVKALKKIVPELIDKGFEFKKIY